jgi:hypothetical protein
VVFGPGDQAARLTPLTDTDADALIRSADAAPRLLGQHGVPATDLDTLRELLLRVPGSPTTCPRSPSSTSARSSPRLTRYRRWTRGSR